MSIENPFEKPQEDKKEPVKGDDFIMKKEGYRKDYGLREVGPNLEFRPGETSETAREREEIEKVQQAEESAQIDRNFIVKNFFEDGIKRRGEYSETFKIKEDGSLDRETSGVINIAHEVRSPEDLYQLMHEISQEHPDLDISFDVDPNGKWIKYRVSKEVEAMK